MPSLSVHLSRSRRRRRPALQVPALVVLALLLGLVAAASPALATGSGAPTASPPPAPKTASGTTDPVVEAVGARQPRVFNGVPASIADLPAVVFIVNNTDSGVCTGSIIAERWVLTAAHCFDQPFNETTPNPSEILVLAGRDQMSFNAADWPEVHTVERAVHHPSWNPQDGSAAHDIALLRLATPTRFPPMALTASGRPDHVGQQATVAGWGITQDEPAVDTEVLRRATVDVRPHESCEQQWAGGYDRNWLLCAGGGPAASDACGGDSGGPLLLESGGTQTIIGVVNSGELCTPQSLLNGIYTGVAAYRTWIDQTLGGAPDPGPTPEPGDPGNVGDVGGEVEVTLTWTGGADLDLHVVDPPGEEIFWDNPVSASGGRLEFDAAPNCGDTGTHVESIFWPEGQAPPGQYAAWVNVYRGCPEPTTYLLEVVIDGEVVDSQSGPTTFDRSPSLLFTVDSGPSPTDPDFPIPIAPDPFDPDPLPTDPDPLPTDPDPLPTDPDPLPTDPDPFDPDPSDPEPFDPDPLPTDPDPLPTDPDPVDPGASGASFLDVPAGFVHEPGILAVAAAGITTGCAPNRYCPAEVVTRGQMATFLMRSLDLTDPGGTPFLDVPADFVHAPGIRAVAAAGITTGCAPNRYCPAEPVSRGQMASFLARSLDLADPGGTPFLDVPAGFAHLTGIRAVAAAGITTGCSADNYCPSEAVTRGQMATFLHRAVLRDSTGGPVG